MRCMLWAALLVWPHIGAAAPLPHEEAQRRCKIGSIREFRLSEPTRRAINIAAGPGGLWFTEPDAGRIARITVNGKITEFPIQDAAPFDIAQGQANDLWFTSPSNARVFRFLLADGTTTSFQTTSDPTYIVNGPGPWIWFGESGRIGRVESPGGPVEEFALPPTYVPQGLTGGSDLWFTVLASGPDGTPVSSIAVMTQTGELTNLPLPNPGAGVRGISGGLSSDTFWFAEHDANRIGQITREGVVQEFPLPTPNSGPVELSLGPDGNLWFTEQLGNRIGRITPAGDIVDFPVPTADARPRDLAQGPDGSMWFTEEGAAKIGRITTSDDCHKPNSGGPQDDPGDGDPVP